MRCIFCKKESHDSKSIEHIIPESLGNKRHLLDRGLVCDGCNNYFSREVEGPLLSHASFRNLRAWYRVPSKKGNEPFLYGFVVGTDIDIGLRVGSDGKLEIKPEREANRTRFDEHIDDHQAGIAPVGFVFPRGIDPPKIKMSRLLAKMALETLALRFSSTPELIDRLIDEPHYDRIRNWARRGDNFHSWPYSQRQIFPEETQMKHPKSGKWVQAGFSCDLFLAKGPETFFAFCLYGYEFVINVGGPSIKGYERWLEDHKHISPLVERFGLKLVNKGKKSFLFGTVTPEGGVQFDRNVVGQSN